MIGPCMLVVVGVVGVALAVLGLVMSAVSFAAMLMQRRDPFLREHPYFWPAYLMMITFCALLLLGHVAAGAQLVRMDSSASSVLLALAGLELAYVGCVQLVVRWAPKRVADSVAAAAGVSTMGLVPLTITGYPLWAPALALWLQWGMGDPSDLAQSSGSLGASSRSSQYARSDRNERVTWT